MAFSYLKDPLFLACFCLYWINRDLEYLDLSTPMFESYLNDIVCIPFWVPILLWVERKLGLRKHDSPPESFEIIIPLLMWAMLFEVVIPAQCDWAVPTVADPHDVLCYCVGGLIAAVFWRSHYRPAQGVNSASSRGRENEPERCAMSSLAVCDQVPGGRLSP